MKSFDDLLQHLADTERAGTPFRFSKLRFFSYDMVRPGDDEFILASAKTEEPDTLTLLFHSDSEPGQPRVLEILRPKGLQLSPLALTINDADKIRFGHTELTREHDHYQLKSDVGIARLTPVPLPILSLLPLP